MTRLAPRDEAELADAIRAAYASGAPLKLTGAGSKTQLGRPATGEELSLAALEGVTLYEPEELVISARAGTPLAKIEALLEAHGQHLAFEPMDYGPLFGLASGEGSIGGLVAVGGGGPRRIKAGAAARSSLGLSLRHRARRDRQIRRPRDEERHRLRSLQTRRRLPRHAGGADRSHLQGASQTRDRTDAAAHGALRRSQPRGAARGFRLAI